MEPLLPSFKCRFQDLPAIGTFVLDSLRRDLDELSTRSVKYKGTAFIDGFTTALAAVNELVNPATFTAQHKRLTAEMEADARAIRPLLDHLDIRLADADDLGRDNPLGPQLLVAPADFGLKPLRSAITAHDAEGIASHGKDVVQRLVLNADVMKAVEYPETELAELKLLLARLAQNNALQNQLISARDANVQTNLKVLNDFYNNYLARVLADGKKAFKESSKAKTDDYTFAKLKARVAVPRPARPGKATPNA
jgi:hypothetical protein